MTFLLKGEGLSAVVDPGSASWELNLRADEGARIRSGPPMFRFGPRSARRWHDFHNKDGRVTNEDRTPLGPGSLVGILAELSAGLEAKVEFGLPAGAPIFLMRLSILNRSSRTIFVDKLHFFNLKLGLRDGPPMPDRSQEALGDGLLELSGERHSLGFYTNGWQSWGFAGALGPDRRLPLTRFGPLTMPLRVNAGTPQPRKRGHFSSDMFSVIGDRLAKAGVLTGFLSQKETFGSIEANLRARPPRLSMWANADSLRLEPGRSFATDWACVQFVDLSEPDGLRPYLEAVARVNGARQSERIPVGWCSWYMYFQRLSEGHIHSAIKWAEAQREVVPLDLIQIDDGYAAEVGDWMETAPGFSGGMESLASRITAGGFLPGIWLAPFVAKGRSNLARTHPEWILRNRLGIPVNPGFLWDTFPRALDVTRPEVREQVRNVIRTVCHEWGYRYLKLDFLYAGALAGERFDPTITRAQALRRVLEDIREEAGEDVYLLGCGCPLGSGVGIFDAMRIGPDVAPRWRPSYLGLEFPFVEETDMPSARNAIRNTLTRAMLTGHWWVNDPDCVLLRESQSLLTAEEVQTLASVIALSSGVLVDSDELPALSPERRRWLSLLLPPISGRLQVLDWFEGPYPGRLLLPLQGPAGSWWIVALLNWAPEEADLSIAMGDLGLDPGKLWHVREFWSGSYQRVEDGRIRFASVPSHGIRVAAVRRDGNPLWIGDGLHISQGLALRSWKVDGSRLEAGLDLGRRASGQALLSLPAAPVRAALSEHPLQWASDGKDRYSFNLSFEGRVNFTVDWG